MSEYIASAWYWIVATHPSQVYSSAVAGYLPVSDASYTAWLAQDNTPTQIASEALLHDVLWQQYSAGLAAAIRRQYRRAAILDALTDAGQADASRDKALALTLLDAYLLLAGRINALLTAIDNGATFTQAKAAVAGIADCPLYTGADLLQLLRNHVNAGEVD